ncbi:hypothetical protein KEM56_001550, partial [Ascosphaera pollenicola]
MSTAVRAPAQFKQPSRKGKKAWRKNVNVTEVQEGLRTLRDEQIQGGVIAEQPSEDLFVLDTKGDGQVEKQRKSRKLLKSEEILAKRSVIPGVDSRKRPSNDKVTDGVTVPSNKKLNCSAAGILLIKCSQMHHGTVCTPFSFAWNNPPTMMSEKDSMFQNKTVHEYPSSYEL